MLGIEEFKNENIIFILGLGDSIDVGFLGYGRIFILILWMRL